MEDMKATNLEILYEDNHVIVVVKPCNVPSQADSSHDVDMLSLIKEYIKKKYNKPGNVYLGLVHRLDRPVGGIMVFAKTSKAASRLSKSMNTLEFKKTYVAVVCGILDKKEDTLIDYIKKDDKFNSIITDKEHGKYAELHYKVLEEKENTSLVLIDLKTGRHHQIRIQFKNIGHPLYGDQRYGVEDKKQIALFATKLSFVHPTKKEWMHFSKRPNYGKFLDFYDKNKD